MFNILLVSDNRSLAPKNGQQAKGDANNEVDQTSMGPTKPKRKFISIYRWKRMSFLLAPNRISPDLSIHDIVQVRCLEYLCRCHILLAYLTHRNQPEYEILLQKSYWFLMRLWQVNGRFRSLGFHYLPKQKFFSVVCPMVRTLRKMLNRKLQLKR